MKAIVFVKEVPETPEGVSVSENGQVQAAGGGNFLTDPIDPFAIETALQLKDAKGGEVHAVTAGNSRAEKILKEALAMGVDNSYLVADDAIEGSDPNAIARVLAGAAKKIGDYDLLVTGDRAADDNASIVTAALAQLLDIPVLTFVSEIREFDADAMKIRVVRTLENGRQVVEATLPAVISVVKGIHEPRYPSLLGIRKASKREVPTWSLADIGVDPATVGAAGSPTKIRSLDPPPAPSGVEMITGSAEEMAATLVQRIMDKKVL